MVLPKRKSTRLNEYDYSSPGAYFVTICTQNRKKILSEIDVGDGVLDVPNNTLSQYGIIVDKTISEMGKRYCNISIDKYVIMPNHVHILLQISESADSKSCDFQNAAHCGTSRAPSPTNSVLAKFVSTFKRFCNKEFGYNIWQRSFHDHVIRGQADYDKIWEYIDTNPIKWELDCFYSD